jgi:hypothetical protein
MTEYSFTHDGVTTYFMVEHNTKKCTGKWEETFVDDVLTVTCPKCGKVYEHNLNPKLDPIVPVPIEIKETISRLSEMKDETIQTN